MERTKSADKGMDKESILGGPRSVVAVHPVADVTEHVPPSGVTAGFASLYPPYNLVGEVRVPQHLN